MSVFSCRESFHTAGSYRRNVRGGRNRRRLRRLQDGTRAVEAEQRSGWA